MSKSTFSETDKMLELVRAFFSDEATFGHGDTLLCWIIGRFRKHGHINWDTSPSWRFLSFYLSEFLKNYLTHFHDSGGTEAIALSPTIASFTLLPLRISSTIVREFSSGMIASCLSVGHRAFS